MNPLHKLSDFRLGLGLCVALSLLLHAVYYTQWADTPFFTTLVGDGDRYAEWARRIAAGDWLGDQPFFQAPLYPYFLALLFALFGDDLWVVHIAQALLGAGSVWLIGQASRRLFSDPAGLLAALLLALYPVALFHDGLVQKPALALFLLALLLWLMAPGLAGERLGWRRALAIGFVLALTAQARENLMILAPLIGLWLLWPQACLCTPPGQRWRLLLAFGLGLALLFGPIALRNYIVGGVFAPTTYQFGVNLYLGNNPQADGYHRPLVEGRGDARFEAEDAVNEARRLSGRDIHPDEVSAFWSGRALDYMRDQPLDWLALMGRKLYLTWLADEAPDTESIEAYADQSSLLRGLLPVWHFGLLAALGLAGVLLSLGDWRRLWPLYGALLLTSLSVALFVIFGRYRYPLVALLLPFAGYALASLPGLLRARRWRLLAPAVLVALLAGWGLSRPPPDPDRIGNARALNYYSVAVRLLEQDRLDESESLLQRVRQLSPNNHYPLVALATLYGRRGDNRSQLDWLARAQRLQPFNAELQDEQAKVIFRQSLADYQLGDARAALALLQRLDRLSLLSARPETISALVLYAELLAGCDDAALRNPPLGLRQARRAERLSAGRSLRVQAALAMALSATGQPAAAIGLLQQALGEARNPQTRARLQQRLTQLRDGQPLRMACR